MGSMSSKNKFQHTVPYYNYFLDYCNCNNKLLIDYVNLENFLMIMYQRHDAMKHVELLYDVKYNIFLDFPHKYILKILQMYTNRISNHYHINIEVFKYIHNITNIKSNNSTDFMLIKNIVSDILKWHEWPYNNMIKVCDFKSSYITDALMDNTKNQHILLVLYCIYRMSPVDIRTIMKNIPIEICKKCSEPYFLKNMIDILRKLQHAGYKYMDFDFIKEFMNTYDVPIIELVTNDSFYTSYFSR